MSGKIAWICLLILAACSPTVSASVEGQACSTVGDEICSLESGHPRARCESDFQWHILESCGAATCAVVSDGSGLNITSCLNGSTATSDTVSSGGDTSSGTKTDSKGSDTIQTISGFSCGGWTCPSGQACTGIDACEDTGCIGCQAGQRCANGACHDLCDNACFASQHCQTNSLDPLGSCAAMACTAPIDVTAAVATAIDWPTGGMAQVACGNGYKGAATTLLAKYGWQDLYSAATVKSGGTTLAWIPLPVGEAFVIGRRSGDCGEGQSCALKLSRHDNLDVDTPGGGVCSYRFEPGSTWAPLPVHSDFERAELRVSKPSLQTYDTAKYVCGFVTAEAVQAVLSQSLGAMGQPIPTATVLAQQVPADFDSNSDGKADAWSIAIEVTVHATTSVVWLP